MGRGRENTEGNKQEPPCGEGVIMKFEVSVNNKILGNSTQMMSMEEIANYNLCAFRCAQMAAIDGKPHTDGMWTVRCVSDVVGCRTTDRHSAGKE